jgi:hypothetical protein
MIDVFRFAELIKEGLDIDRCKLCIAQIWRGIDLVQQISKIFSRRLGLFLFGLGRARCGTVLSLLPAATDNVALAAMQAGLILNHPLPVWAIRFLFVMLMWAGGLTAFGCLQSLALHAKRPLSMGAWFREARGWAVIALIGGLIGLVAIILIYPGELSVPR